MTDATLITLIMAPIFAVSHLFIAYRFYRHGWRDGRAHGYGVGLSQKMNLVSELKIAFQNDRVTVIESLEDPNDKANP